MSRRPSARGVIADCAATTTTAIATTRLTTRAQGRMLTLMPRFSLGSPPHRREKHIPARLPATWRGLGARARTQHAARGVAPPVPGLQFLTSVSAREWLAQMRSLFRRETSRKDAVAGLVLGVQSVPDGLAAGLLAGVNPISGLYGYMVGTFVGAMTTSAAFMTVQTTGAMATIIADVPEV